MAVIGTLMAGRTVILVSHREHLPADRVLVLEQGTGSRSPAGVR